MNKKIRKVIGIISILFIIGMFLVKGLNNYSDIDLGQMIPMVITTILVSSVKVAIICFIVYIGKRLFNLFTRKNKKDIKE